MKLLKYLASFAAAAGVLSACTTDLDTVEALSIENAAPATIHALTEDIVITADNQGEEVTFSWDAADFGVTTPINYSIWAAYEGKDREIFSNITKTSFTATLEQLNQPLYNDMKLPAEEPAAVAFRIGATIGSSYPVIYSEPSTVNVTVTAAEKRYPVIWVIGDYCSWDFTKAQNLYSFTSDGTNFEGFIDFGDKAKNGFKLSGAAGWDDTCNWGSDGTAPADEASSVQLINSGGSSDLKCYSKRFYKFAFSKDNLLLEVKNSFNQLGIVGGFTNWADGADVVMNFNPEKRRFWADVEGLSGEFKFRADGGWDVNWGAGEGENALTPGGANINVTEAGNYRVYAYLSNSEELRYELDAEMYGQAEAGTPTEPEPDQPDEPDQPELKENLWDVIGAVNGTSWTGAAAYMNEAGPGVWYSSFVNVEGEFKFRYNNSWEEQIGKGAAELVADGSLCAGSGDKGSGNFKLDPGTYQFIIYTETREVRAIAIDGTGWGVIGSLAGFSWNTDLMMYTAENGLLAAQGIKLTAANEFKFREANAWSKSYGFGAMTPNSVADAVSENGANITVSEDGVYDLYLDLAGEKIYVMKAGTPISAAAAPGEVAIDLTGHSWGICGSISNWTDIPMTVEGDFVVAKNITLTTADEFKPRADGNWDLNYGYDGVVEIGKGTELTRNAKNIKVSANGTYDIYFGLKTAYLYVMEAGQKPAL